MFLQANRARYADTSGSKVTPSQPAAKPASPSGIEVVVVEPGVYNGPGHRRLPPAVSGQIIRVATADYAVALAASGLVRIPTETEQVQAAPVRLQELDADTLETMGADLQEIVDLAATSDSIDWVIFFADLKDVTPAVKKRLWDQGYQTKEIFRQRFLQQSFAMFDEVKGVNRKVAVKIMLWAGELEEVLLNDSLR